MAKKPQKEIRATDNQWTFASDYVRNRSMLSAFQAAYPKHGDKPMFRKRAMAKRIYAQKGTQLAIQELTEDVKRAEKLTVESHMAELKSIGKAAFQDGKWTAALKAEELRGKCAGFYIERSMNVNVSSSPDQLKSQMEALLEQHPQMATFLGVEQPRILVESNQSYSLQETGEDKESQASDEESLPKD